MVGRVSHGLACVARIFTRLIHTLSMSQDTLIHGTAAYLNRTHCKQGHEFTPENTYNQPMPKRRVCRECQRLARLKHNAKRQAQKEAA